MLTGRRPFTGDTKLSTLAAIVNQEQTSARQIVKELPPELDRIIARCLPITLQPSRRFPAAAPWRFWTKVFQCDPKGPLRYERIDPPICWPSGIEKILSPSTPD